MREVCCSFKNNGNIGILLLKWFLILEAVVTKTKTRAKSNKQNKQTSGHRICCSTHKKIFPLFSLLKGAFPFLILFSLIPVAHYILHDDMGTYVHLLTLLGNFCSKGTSYHTVLCHDCNSGALTTSLLVLSMSLLLFPLILYPHGRQNDLLKTNLIIITPPSKSFTGFPAFLLFHMESIPL